MLAGTNGAIDDIGILIDRPARDGSLRMAGAADPTDITGKRAVDLAAALLLLALLMPLLALVALAVWAGDQGPILFRHRRIGRDGRSFDCLKFRSMVTDADTRLARILAIDPAAREEWARDHKLRDDPRITPIGRFLRRTSLDELPQLFNVLAGDMSMVGPRPIVPAEVSRYGRHFASYCQVRPGLTGLWQVSGRNDTSYRRRVVLDVVYVQRCSARLDAAIVFRTFPSVFGGKGCH